MTQIVLASGSKTRADMLEKAGLDFSVFPARVDEDALKASLIAQGLPARGIADALAETKARSVSGTYPQALVIGADQLLVKDGKIVSKAKDIDQARDVLTNLSGGVHQLISAVVVYENGQAVWRAVDTVKLTMRPLSKDFIDGYLKALGEDAFWSVGAYQLEGLGAQLFTKVDGSHFTVLGLPLLPLLDFLRRRNVMPL